MAHMDNSSYLPIHRPLRQALLLHVKRSLLLSQTSPSLTVASSLTRRILRLCVLLAYIDYPASLTSIRMSILYYYGYPFTTPE